MLRPLASTTPPPSRNVESFWLGPENAGPTTRKVRSSVLMELPSPITIPMIAQSPREACVGMGGGRFIGIKTNDRSRLGVGAGGFVSKGRIARCGGGGGAVASMFIATSRSSSSFFATSRSPVGARAR